MHDDLHIDAYDFDLPEGQIAQVPAPKREDSRLLIVDRDQDEFQQTEMNQFIQHLKGDEVLVVNDMLGMTEKPPKFVKQYADLRSVMQQSFRAFREDVEQQNFPEPEHGY